MKYRPLKELNGNVSIGKVYIISLSENVVEPSRELYDFCNIDDCNTGLGSVDLFASNYEDIPDLRFVNFILIDIISKIYLRYFLV